MNMSIFWIVTIAVMLVLEISTTALVSIWFVGGGLAALLLSLLHFPIWLQAAAFFFVSAVLFLTCRGWLEAHFRPAPEQDALASLKNSIGTVTTRIDPVEGGRILIRGQDWKAVSANGKLIEEGKLVRVQEIRGVRMFVIPIDQPPMLP